MAAADSLCSTASGGAAPQPAGAAGGCGAAGDGAGLPAAHLPGVHACRWTGQRERYARLWRRSALAGAVHRAGRGGAGGALARTGLRLHRQDGGGDAHTAQPAGRAAAAHAAAQASGKTHRRDERSAPGQRGRSAELHAHHRQHGGAGGGDAPGGLPAGTGLGLAAGFGHAAGLPGHPATVPLAAASLRPRRTHAGTSTGAHAGRYAGIHTEAGGTAGGTQCRFPRATPAGEFLDPGKVAAHGPAQGRTAQRDRHQRGGGGPAAGDGGRRDLGDTGLAGRGRAGGGDRDAVTICRTALHFHQHDSDLRDDRGSA